MATLYIMLSLSLIYSHSIILFLLCPSFLCSVQSFVPHTGGTTMLEVNKWAVLACFLPTSLEHLIQVSSYLWRSAGYLLYCHAHLDQQGRRNT